MIDRPLPTEYPEYYLRYVDAVMNDDVLTVLREQMDDVAWMFDGMDEERALFRYAEGKWTIKEVMGHLVDSERMFGMRAMCLARGEQQSMPGFDQDDYVVRGRFNDRSLTSILNEWALLREANVELFATLDEPSLQHSGVANNKPVTTRAVIWIIAGHVQHHLNILEERYGIELPT
jgi:hypothetical protein